MAEEKRGVMCFTVGSINYSLETESSDRDELHFVLPSSLRHVMLGNICKTTQTIDEKAKVDRLEVDVRNIMQWIKKPNMSNSSFLWAKEVRYWMRQSRLFCMKIAKTCCIVRSGCLRNQWIAFRKRKMRKRS